MPFLRHERVRELLKRAIGEAVRREFNVDEVGLITVNDVDVGGDLKSAMVFVSLFGNAGQQKRALQVLEQNRIRLQGLVAKSVVLKYTPTLKFAVDDSIVRGNKVLQIIEELEKESGGKTDPSADPSDS
jgi:ribosome-binding factor A